MRYSKYAILFAFIISFEVGLLLDIFLPKYGAVAAIISFIGSILLWLFINKEGQFYNTKNK